MNSIDLSGHVFFFDVIRKPIRSIRLHLKSKDTFSVSCSIFTPNFILQKFIKSNAAWILKNASKITPKKRLSDLTHLSILGTDYQLTLDPRSKFKINNLDHQIFLKNISSLKTALRPYALKLIKNELTSLQPLLGFKYGRLTVRNQKTRFGSCSTRGNLNFNWQIIFFPHALFRHVILHEVTHLTHHNHSQSFWSALSAADPNWKANNIWLKKEGSKCFIIQP
jgi:hypothetical protein